MGDGKYTLDHLLRVGCELEYMGKVFYLRTLSARQDELRQVGSLNKAREFRKRLQDEGSAEYRNYMASLMEGTREEWIEVAAATEERRLATVARQEVEPENEAVVPDEATLADVLDAEDEQEQIDEDIDAKRKAWVGEQMALWRAEAATWDDDLLKGKAKESHADALITKTYSEWYNDLTLQYAVYTDSQRKRPFFKAVEDVSECSSALKARLLVTYFDLDAASRDAEILKNLHGDQ